MSREILRGGRGRKTEGEGMWAEGEVGSKTGGR